MDINANGPSYVKIGSRIYGLIETNCTEDEAVTKAIEELKERCDRRIDEIERTYTNELMSDQLGIIEHIRNKNITNNLDEIRIDPSDFGKVFVVGDPYNGCSHPITKGCLNELKFFKHTYNCVKGIPNKVIDVLMRRHTHSDLEICKKIITEVVQKYLGEDEDYNHVSHECREAMNTRSFKFLIKPTDVIYDLPVDVYSYSRKYEKIFCLTSDTFHTYPDTKILCTGNTSSEEFFNSSDEVFKQTMNTINVDSPLSSSHKSYGTDSWSASSNADYYNRPSTNFITLYDVMYKKLDDGTIISKIERCYEERNSIWTRGAIDGRNN